MRATSPQCICVGTTRRHFTALEIDRPVHQRRFVRWLRQDGGIDRRVLLDLALDDGQRLGRLGRSVRIGRLGRDDRRVLVTAGGVSEVDV